MNKKSSASEYAKAKVEEIRKKFGYAHMDKQNQIKTSIGKQSSSTPKMNININAPSKKTGPLQIQINMPQYNNRIKNIDVINEKITKFLKQSQKKISQFKVQKPKSQRRNDSQLVQSTLINVQKSPEHSKMKVEEIKSYVILQEQQNQQKTIQLPIKKQQTYTKYKCLNNKQTISRQLLNMPLNLQKQTLFENTIVHCGQKLKAKHINQAKHEQTNMKFQQQHMGKNETRKLAQSLNQQILKDQKLRFSKFLFSEWEEPKKWQILIQKFKTLTSTTISLQDAKKLFVLPSQEHNPFFQKSETLTEKDIQELVRNWQDAENYWVKSVKQCVSVEKLEKQNFNVKDIDLSKKGFISTQDLVCFVNLHAGNFFRNRDAISVFKRFAVSEEKQKALKYQNFLDVVTY